MIFLKATRSNGHHIRQLWDDYGPISGQKFSPTKSRIIYGSTATNWFKRYVRQRTWITTCSLPFTYLGIPIFLGAPKFNTSRRSIIQRFAKWCGHTLSLARRHCLINSVIASSLVHTMMVYKWPKSLLHRIEVAIRCYLWSGDINCKGFSNVEWKHCCAPLDEGGFGIRSIQLVNASFFLQADLGHTHFT